MKKMCFSTAAGPFCTADVADNPWTRFRGLLGMKLLPDGTGLWIKPCSSVHTLFMSFPIDVVYLTKEQSIARLHPHLQPFRFSWGGWRASSTLELPAGSIARARLSPGELITISECA